MTEDQERRKMILHNHLVQAAAVHQVQTVKVVQIRGTMTLVTSQRRERRRASKLRRRNTE